MTSALFINGIFPAVLQEILDSQEARNGGDSFLQPHSSGTIKMLKKQDPSAGNPVSLFASTTDNLPQICFTAEIIGWEDKRELTDARRAEVHTHLQSNQPQEVELFGRQGEFADKAINLISIRNLRRLDSLYSTSLLQKVSDGISLSTKRSRSGGWSEVFDPGDLIDLPPVERERSESLLQNEVKQAECLSDEELNELLSKAPKMPKKVQVVSAGYQRNPHVIAAALRRAKGICDHCKGAAPFIRRSNGTPYLEVHHWTPLSQGGEDVLDNAGALCPNCHRELHFGSLDGLNA